MEKKAGNESDSSQPTNSVSQIVTQITTLREGMLEVLKGSQSESELQLLGKAIGKLLETVGQAVALKMATSVAPDTSTLVHRKRALQGNDVEAKVDSIPLTPEKMDTLSHQKRWTPSVANEINEALQGNDVEAKVDTIPLKARQIQDNLKRATGELTKDDKDANKLNRILHLTGFSEPVYAEAYVTVHHYDIAIKFTVINRTKETLRNLRLQLATMGDLKLVEPPQKYILAPETSMQIKANIKASSTESGVIFGNMVYETSNIMERNVVVLNDIHIDIMDYISPNVCSGVASRTTCAEFDWENKVVAWNSTVENQKEFYDHALKSTNFMKHLIVPCVKEGKLALRIANSYAASVFPNDDTSVFLGIDKKPAGGLVGYISISRMTPEIATKFEETFTLRQSVTGEVSLI